MSRSRAKILLLGGLLLSVLGVLGATSCEVGPGVYGLTADTRLTTGCFPPLACPALAATDVGGTFRLSEAPFANVSLFDTFRVTDVYWLARLGGKDVPITGSGVYMRGGEFALMHRLQLDLRVGDQDVESFDSGLVVVDSALPGINVRISIHGEQFMDTVIDVHAIPFPPDR